MQALNLFGSSEEQLSFFASCVPPKTSRYMFPGSTLHNPTDGCFAYSKTSGNSSDRLPGFMPTANALNLFRCQFGLPLPLAARLSPFRIAVDHVFHVSAKVQVVWIHAVAYIASMHDLLPLRNLTFVQAVRKLVSTDGTFAERANTQPTIAPNQVPGPQPTVRFELTLVHLLPKTLLNRLWVQRHASHHLSIPALGGTEWIG